MRFILFLFVALGLTMVWQTSTLAAGTVGQAFLCADAAGGKDQKSGTKDAGPGDEEPDCE
jgi:hypothetical protein